jgi:hypothetical protein
MENIVYCTLYNFLDVKHKKGSLDLETLANFRLQICMRHEVDRYV